MHRTVNFAWLLITLNTVTCVAAFFRSISRHLSIRCKHCGSSQISVDIFRISYLGFHMCDLSVLTLSFSWSSFVFWYPLIPSKMMSPRAKMVSNQDSYFDVLKVFNAKSISPFRTRKPEKEISNWKFELGLSFGVGHMLGLYFLPYESYFQLLVGKRGGSRFGR